MLLVSVFVLALSTSSLASAKEGFSDKSVKGTYGFNVESWLPVDPPTPVAIVGVITFDCSGGCNVTNILNDNGTSLGFRDSTFCVYAVRNDGIGEIELTFVPASTTPTTFLAFAITDGGKQLLNISTQNSVATGIFIRR